MTQMTGADGTAGANSGAGRPRHAGQTGSTPMLRIRRQAMHHLHGRSWDRCGRRMISGARSAAEGELSTARKAPVIPVIAGRAGGWR